jgi:hypothetical protein
MHALVAQVPDVPPIPDIPFDPNYLAGELAPLIGVVVAILGAAVVLKALLGSSIAEALAERIRGRRAPRPGRGPAGEGGDAERVAGLAQELAHLQREVAELAERLDFAERMLADRRQPQLRAGEPSGHHG